ncbi:lipopolysaccharide biosynthesis protein [Novipirellula herctigrandis]|uniref:lipopolysaccharide biosynthesis protein n=1 Tax=Novipirellula herctigrandis TaxID=2527986 RepID=UPI003AF39514
MLKLVSFGGGVAAFSFAANFLLARYLPTSDYGFFSWCLFISQLFFVFSAFGMDRTLVPDLVQSEDKKTLISGSLLLNLVAGSISLPPILYFIWAQSETFSQSITAVAIVVTGILLAASPKAVYDASRKMSSHASMILAEKGIYMLSVAVVLFLAEPEHAFVWVAVALCATRVVSFVMQWSKATIWPGGSIEQAGKSLAGLFQRNFLVFIACCFSVLITHAAPLILKDQLGSSAMACYAIAFQFSLLTQLVISQTTRLEAPTIASAVLRPEPIRPMIWKMLMHSSLVSAGVSIAIGIVGSLTIYYFLPVALHPGIPVLWVISIWSTALGPGRIVNQFTVSMGLNRQYLAATILSGLIAVGLGYFLIQAFGVVGCAINLLVSHMVGIMTQITAVLGAATKRDEDIAKPRTLEA